MYLQVLMNKIVSRIIMVKKNSIDFVMGDI